MMFRKTQLTLLPAAAFAVASAHASPIISVAENSPGGPTTPGGPGELMFDPDVSNSDLLQGIVGVESGSWGTPASRLNDGVHGGSFDQGAGTTGIAWPTVGASVTFTLGLGANGLGYDITSIQSIAAWQSAGFGNQGYTLEVQPVGASFMVLETVLYNPLGGGGGATRIVITDDGTGPGGILATGIEAIRFTQNNVPGAVDGRSTYRELDVFGSDTVAAVPEASEAIVLLLGMTGLLAGRRRRRRS